jgi:hypothetical protein
LQTPVPQEQSVQSGREKTSQWFSNQTTNSSFKHPPSEFGNLDVLSLLQVASHAGPDDHFF